MPCVVISVTEDDVIGTHLYTAVELIPSDIVGDGVRTYEITFTIFIVLGPDAWSVVDHTCSAGISICQEFVQTSLILVVVLLGKDKTSIVGIDFSMIVSSILPCLWWFFRITILIVDTSIDVIDVVRSFEIPIDLGLNILLIWFAKDGRFVS